MGVVRLLSFVVAFVGYLVSLISGMSESYWEDGKTDVVMFAVVHTTLFGALWAFFMKLIRLRPMTAFTMCVATVYSLVVLDAMLED